MTKARAFLLNTAGTIAAAVTLSALTGAAGYAVAMLHSDPPPLAGIDRVNHVEARQIEGEIKTVWGQYCTAAIRRNDLSQRGILMDLDSLQREHQRLTGQSVTFTPCP